MPCYRLRQVERARVAAAPGETWKAARALDVYQAVPAFRWLVGLRVLPDRLRGEGEPPLRQATLDAIAAGGAFALLADGSPEVVLGAIGTFWEPNIRWRRVAPEEFARFDEPGWGKVVWNLRVDPRGPGSWLTCELRVTATDDASWRRFRPYWRLIGPFSHGVRRAAVGRLARQLGAPSRDALPGDELLPEARFERTHATVIEAPPAAVWPWLVQMGARRGGWYSIDRLDNGGRPSATRIVPELQGLAVGDRLPYLPSDPGGALVELLEPGGALVLTGATGADRTSWAFALAPIGDDATELQVRVRAAYPPGIKKAAAIVAIAAAHEVMQRAQLRHLKQRVEAAA